jgi:glycine cleavage system H protein
MPTPLVFMMGRSPVFLPTDRHYARNHMWAVEVPEGWRFGFSAYAVKLLGDLRHLEWSVRPGTAVEGGQSIGFIEGSKATSDLYTPVAGQVRELNDLVVADPTLLNSNLYDTAWLLSIAGRDAALLSAQEYLAHLESVWPLAQRLLKGHSPASES